MLIVWCAMLCMLWSLAAYMTTIVDTYHATNCYVLVHVITNADPTCRLPLLYTLTQLPF